MKAFAEAITKVKKWEGPRTSGRVTKVVGLAIESLGPKVAIGELCAIYGQKGVRIDCEVVGFKDESVFLMPFTDMTHIAPGSEVCPMNEILSVGVSDDLLGRVIDPLGRPIDDKGPISLDRRQSVQALAPRPLSRLPIDAPLVTQINAIDHLMTLGKGQRVGIVSGSGVGKSTLLGQIAASSQADVNVIALIGERGREVGAFIEKVLGPSVFVKSVIVVATSDESPLLRSTGAFTATAIAEYFKDKGKDVLLMMDSVTRFAQARREIGLSVGEPLATRGYTPSIFPLLAKLVERAGRDRKGSITALYTVLCEADDLDDPIADVMRSLLDGHITLSRARSERGIFPPIDPLKSLSRLMPDIASKVRLEGAKKIRTHLATYLDAEELIHIGAYKAGSNPRIDKAIEVMPRIESFLQQKITLTDEALLASL